MINSVCQQYQATGRGFVVKHIKFSENYRLYSRSHFVKGWSPRILFGSYALYTFLMYTYLAVVKDGKIHWYATFCFFSLGWRLFSYWLFISHMVMMKLVPSPTFCWLLAAGFWLLLGFLLHTCSTLPDLSGKSKWCYLIYILLSNMFSHWTRFVFSFQSRGGLQRMDKLALLQRWNWCERSRKLGSMVGRRTGKN